jgi:hypothetical protein
MIDKIGSCLVLNFEQLNKILGHNLLMNPICNKNLSFHINES